MRQQRINIVRVDGNFLRRADDKNDFTLGRVFVPECFGKVIEVPTDHFFIKLGQFPRDRGRPVTETIRQRC